MSAEFNRMKTLGVTGSHISSCVGKKEQLAHPCNCKNECPYGYGRAFCFPCMARIMTSHRANRIVTPMKG